jgi:hypothetical protein
VEPSALGRLQAHASGLKALAMELTDTWGGAMFIMSPSLVEKIFSTMGFQKSISTAVYESVRALAYVQHRRVGQPTQSEFTYHGQDGTALTLRGCVNLRKSFAGVSDGTISTLLRDNKELFGKLMDVMPEYSRDLMFSTEVACNVINTFGAQISQDRMYDLALEFGGQNTLDLEGRRGVPTQFVRSLTLTLSATV